MAYKPSPRPVFDGPTAIRYASVTRHLWGDDAAGRIDDWIHVLTDKIHQLVFGMPPGQGFRHSESFRTVFGADEVLTVLMLTGITASTDQLTAGAVRIAPGGPSDARAYGGALGIYVTTGRLNSVRVQAPDSSTRPSGSSNENSAKPSEQLNFSGRSRSPNIRTNTVKPRMP